MDYKKLAEPLVGITVLISIFIGIGLLYLVIWGIILLIKYLVMMRPL